MFAGLQKSVAGPREGLQYAVSMIAGRAGLRVFTAVWFALALTTSAGEGGLSALFRVDTRLSRADTDSDGLPDAYEQRVGLNYEAHDSGADPDGDGMTNAEEYRAGTNPFHPDRPENTQGFSAAFEVDTGGRLADSDGDGLPDWWERIHFGNATSAMRAADADGDGHSNGHEFLAGTDPMDAASVLRLRAVWRGTALTLQWPSVEHRTYSLWRAEPVSFLFRAVESNIVATPPMNSFTNGGGATIELYRVAAED